MNYYIDSIEQIKKDAGGYTEYGARTKESGTLDEIRSKMFQKVTNVLNDLGESGKHTFMDIRITNSVGGCVEKYVCGQYIES
jgi:hypothetical protein